AVTVSKWLWDRSGDAYGDLKTAALAVAGKLENMAAAFAHSFSDPRYDRTVTSSKGFSMVNLTINFESASTSAVYLVVDAKTGPVKAGGSYHLLSDAQDSKSNTYYQGVVLMGPDKSVTIMGMPVGAKYSLKTL